MEKEILEIAGQSVEIDPAVLKFSEQTLTTYIQTEGGYYDNFGGYLALAEKVLQLREMNYEKIYAERFAEAKQDGSDKLAEAKAKADVDVLDARQAIIEARYKVKRIQNHLKAWDKNHDNAQSLGHMLRKEMDKLSHDVIYRRNNYEDQVHDIVKPYAGETTPADFDLNALGIDTVDLGDL